MKMLPVLIAGIALGGATVWYLEENYSKNPPAIEAAGAQTPSTVAGDTIDDKLSSLKLRTEDIKDEMAREGRVVRQKTQATVQNISDATADARATTVIKGKLVADPNLSAVDVSVNTTQGVVTLSGTVSSDDKIGKAMLVALQTSGVHEVISTLQVKPM